MFHSTFNWTDRGPRGKKEIVVCCYVVCIWFKPIHLMMSQYNFRGNQPRYPPILMEIERKSILDATVQQVFTASCVLKSRLFLSR